MCNCFQNKSPTYTYLQWIGILGMLSELHQVISMGASPTGSPRWGHCLQRQLACEGLYGLKKVDGKFSVKPILLLVLKTLSIRFNYLGYTFALIRPKLTWKYILICLFKWFYKMVHWRLLLIKYWPLLLVFIWEVAHCVLDVSSECVTQCTANCEVTGHYVFHKLTC